MTGSNDVPISHTCLTHIFTYDIHAAESDLRFFNRETLKRSNRNVRQIQNLAADAGAQLRRHLVCQRLTL